METQPDREVDPWRGTGWPTNIVVDKVRIR